jgi:hypothetical protein
MLGRSGNPVNWDNFRKVVVLVLILWAAVSAVLCIIYFFILGGRSPAPVDIFRALILAAPCLQSGGGGRLGQMISARPITVLLRNPTTFGGLCETSAGRSAIASSGIGWLMASVIYRCPTKAVNVQVWFDEPTNDRATYISVRCPACARVHFVNPVTGKTPADG